MSEQELRFELAKSMIAAGWDAVNIKNFLEKLSKIVRQSAG